MDINVLNEFNETVIAHNDFKMGLAKLNSVHDLKMKGYKKSLGIALLGESGLGKTTMLKTSQS